MCAGVGVVLGERWQLERELGTATIVFEPPGMKYALTGNAAADRGRGYSDSREPSPKEPWRQRVITVGDSVTFGVSVAPREAWPGALQALLPSSVDVLNFGVNGYDAEQVASLVESRLAAWKPDLVVWGTYTNDLAPTYMLYGTKTGDPVFVGNHVPEGARVLPEPLSLWLVRRSALFRRLQGGFYSRLVAEKGAVVAEPEWYPEQVRRVRQWTQEHGVDLVVMVLTPHVLADEPGCPSRHAEPKMCEGAKLAYQRITSVLAMAGLPYVDGLAAYQASGQPAFFPEGRDDPDHPNPAGHGILASAVAPAVAARLVARKPVEEQRESRRRRPPEP